MMKTISILNGVLGPVMAGPSSSHTAAPGKIGRAVRQLWGRDIGRATVTYDASGSYPKTHIGQGSDFGFTGGLLGMSADHPDFWDSIRLSKEKGNDIRFEIAPLTAGHPNEARIDVFKGKNRVPAMSVLSHSTGGGTFLLTEMDGFPIENDGQRGHCYLCADETAIPGLVQKLNAMGAVFELLSRTGTATGGVILPEHARLADVELQSLPKAPAVSEIFKADGLIYLRTLPAIAAAELRLNASPPFTTAAGAAAYAAEHPRAAMSDLALVYETALCIESEAAIRKQMKRILSVMRSSMLPPPENWPVTTYIVPAMAAALKRAEDTGHMGRTANMGHTANRRKTGEAALDMGILNGAMSTAAAVMENSCAHRTVVAAPTAGSCGVIPAAVVNLGERLGCDDEMILNALWAAGLIGSFIANEATFGAEAAGCQAEIGSAAAMAAAGVVELSGGTVIQGFHAASIAMQSLMGLICDPVAGLTEFPCIERNVTAANVAVTSANMALCGMTSPIPLDETVLTMLEVGKMLPRELRCTCGGGLCTTPTGRGLAGLAE